MKNLDYITNNFEEIGMFQKIDEQQIKILNKHDTLYSFRKDGFCQRIFSYLNCLRISKKLNKKTVILWDTSENSSYQVIHGHQINDHLVYKNLPIRYVNTDKENIDKYSDNILGIYGKIYYFEDEKLENVLEELSRLAKSLELNKPFNEVFKNVEKHHWGLHVRSGDITATESHLTKGMYRWENRYLDGYKKWFPETGYMSILESLGEHTKIYIASSSKEFLDTVSSKKKIFTNKNYIFNKKNNPTEKLILDIIMLSSCENIICTQKSAVSILIILLSDAKIYFPEDYLNIKNVYKELFTIIHEHQKFLIHQGYCYINL